MGGRKKERERERERETEPYLMPPSNVSDTLLASQVSDTALGCMCNDNDNDNQPSKLNNTPNQSSSVPTQTTHHPLLMHNDVHHIYMKCTCSDGIHRCTHTLYYGIVFLSKQHAGVCTVVYTCSLNVTCAAYSRFSLLLRDQS